MTTSSERTRACDRACRAMPTGSAPSETKPTPFCCANWESCSMAAGRYTSTLHRRTCFFSRSFKKRASFAAVVFSRACSPASRMTAGGVTGGSSSSLGPHQNPRFIINHFDDRLTRLRLPSTACPTAFSRTRSRNPHYRQRRASSSAIRTSRNASFMFSSLRGPSG